MTLEVEEAGVPLTFSAGGELVFTGRHSFSFPEVNCARINHDLYLTTHVKYTR